MYVSIRRKKSIISTERQCARKLSQTFSFPLILYWYYLFATLLSSSEKIGGGNTVPPEAGIKKKIKKNKKSESFYQSSGGDRVTETKAYTKYKWAREFGLRKMNYLLLSISSCSSLEVRSVRTMSPLIRYVPPLEPLSNLRAFFQRKIYRPTTPILLGGGVVR